MLTNILHDIQSKSQERGALNNAGRTALVTKVLKKKEEETKKTPRNEEAKSNNLRDKRLKIASAKPTEEPISHKSVQRHQKRIYNDRYDKH